MPDPQTLLQKAERQVARTVAAVLDEVADEFADAVDGADELMAAWFSVGSIAGMWARRLPRIIRRLLGVAETAAHQAADSVGGDLDDTWTDLPGRYDDGRALPPGIGQYVQTTEHLLRAVGDQLAEAARAELAEGVAAGEDTDQLRARLRARLAANGPQLGTARRERTAATEAARAWNTATLEAARALSGPDRPLVKQWRTRGDSRVRDSHKAVDGQLRLLDEPFNVGGHAMMHPGDPNGPASECVNCRCHLRLERAPARAALTPDPKDLPRVHVFKTEESPPVTPTNQDAVTAAAGGSHLEGAMIALIPTRDDAQRLALEDGEPADELHLTLYNLGDDGTAWSQEQRQALADNVRARIGELGGPITARAFGANHWNPDTSTPAWVWAVGDDPDRDTDAPTLNLAHALATDALESTGELPEIPRQHSPWAPHVCAAYSDDPALLPALEERLGPITFDRIRLAFAGDRIDIPLTPEPEGEETMPNETASAGLPTRSWSTPAPAALAWENRTTGDGRVIAPGALEWSTDPLPLQYADEMLYGHQGAELAGAITSVGRDGDRITGAGVLYLTQRAGAEAAMLLEEDAPLGVSLDLDDVDIQVVDRTTDQPEGEGPVLAASLTSASLLPLNDGGWMITAHQAADWQASAGVLTRRRHTIQLITGPGGQINAAALTSAFTGTGLLPDQITAAAGDPDDPEAGTVVHTERSGDFLIRITRARVRGATLVAVPAFEGARIVLDPLPEEEQPDRAASAHEVTAAGEVRTRVITYVRSSPTPVGAAEVARAVGIGVSAARKHLAEAVKTGHLKRLSPGLYIGVSHLPEGEETTASLSGTPHAHPVPDEALRDLMASAWTAMQDADPMPAAWFREPTLEELPPGSGGVHYDGGRIYGWVAQAGEPHAGYPGRNLTIESLGDIDLTHFLRARFKLDDGTYIKVGAFTMNVPHSRDGAECDTASCQFDDTRTVAGIVTVGLNERGMWFSGAAAPWLSQWDRAVFRACQPSYHMRQGPDGRWQLRAVLSVPVPGHSSPLLTAAVERSNLALAASAAASTAPSPAAPQTPAQPEGTPLTASEPVTGVEEPPTTPGGNNGESITAALTRPEVLDTLLDALTRRQAERDAERRAEVERLSAAFTATPPAITF